MKALHGLTIVAAVSAEQNKLASERISPFESQLDLILEVGLTVDVAA